MGSASSAEAGEEEQDEKSKENFPFLSLPYDLQRTVLAKTEFRLFVKLMQTSEHVKALCESIAGPIPHYIEAFHVNKRRVNAETYWGAYNRRHPRRIAWQIATERPARLIASHTNVNARLTPKKCERLARTFSRKGSKSFSLYIREHMECKPEDVNKLLKVLEPTYFESRVYMRREFFDLPAIKNITSIESKSSRITDKQLLALNCKYIYLHCDTISAQGINAFLKSWKFGDRNLGTLHITFDTSAGTRSDSVILSDLDANTVWTPDDHPNSLLRNISLVDLHEVWSDEPRRVYSLFKSNDISNIFLIYLSSTKFEIVSTTEEKEFLFTFLDEDTFYKAMDECWYCGTKFCSHRKRYSICRLARSFPKYWSFLMGCVTGIRLLLQIVDF